MLLNFRGAMKGARDCENRLGRLMEICFVVIRGGAVLLLLVFALWLHPSLASAQDLDPAALLKPPTDTWPTYNGDYSGRRFSTTSVR